MLSAIIIFITGVAVLLFSTQNLIFLAEKLSGKIKLSPLVIGITIVAIGTSLPELSVSGIAALQGDSGLALGNIIGSNISNVFLVLAIGILFGNIRIGTAKTQRNTLMMLLATNIFLFSIAVFHIPPISGLILLVCAVLFTSSEYFWGLRGRENEDKIMLDKQKNGSFNLRDVLFLSFCLAGIFAGGVATVRSVETLAAATGYSTTVLGLSLTAIVTSLPELLTTILSVKEHEEKISIGNILGSNIYNLLFIGAVVALITPIAVIPGSDWLFFIAATSILSVIVFYYKGRVIPKFVGILLLLCFFAFILNLTLSQK
ncbi:MAG: sodium:calcium antiporter [Patescibacteria group bacterium]|nr:sodium:calcium antiporter [Patescibacteria group bacterium]